MGEKSGVEPTVFEARNVLPLVALNAIPPIGEIQSDFPAESSDSWFWNLTDQEFVILMATILSLTMIVAVTGLAVGSDDPPFPY